MFSLGVSPTAANSKVVVNVTLPSNLGIQQSALATISELQKAILAANPQIKLDQGQLTQRVYVEKEFSTNDPNFAPKEIGKLTKTPGKAVIDLPTGVGIKVVYHEDRIIPMGDLNARLIDLIAVIPGAPSASLTFRCIVTAKLGNKPDYD